MAIDSQNSKVFISYRRQISDVYAGRLYDRLVNWFGDNAKIFMDIDSIEPGDDFVKVIENAVSKCNVLVAVIGKEWTTVTDSKGNRRLDDPEDFVRLEIAAALKRDIRVIPVLVQGAEMPSADELPDDLKGLRRRNAVSISNDRWNDDANRVIKAIEGELNIQREDSPSAKQMTDRRIESAATETLPEDNDGSSYKPAKRYFLIALIPAIVSLILVMNFCMSQKDPGNSMNGINSNSRPASTANLPPATRAAPNINAKFPPSNAAKTE